MMTNNNNNHGFEFYDDTWQLIPPDYGATEYEWVVSALFLLFFLELEMQFY